jgi:tight adherence protein C
MLVFENFPILWLAAATFIAILAATLLVSTPRGSAVRVARLAQYTTFSGSPGTSVEFTSARERLIAPLLNRFLTLAAGTAPRRVRKAAVAELTMAGSTMSPTVFLGIRGVVMFGVPLLAVVWVMSSSERTIVQFAMLGVSLLLGRRLPSIWLQRQIKKRQRAINRALPYALDLIVACLEGGLSLDASLAKVTEESDGPLADELQRTLQEMSLGRPAAEAMKDLGERTGATELKRLTDNVVQAQRLGVSIVESMRTLASESRVRRRQQAEETARKAPVKMVPILIFCILPALAGVVMTPAALTLMKIFSQTHR